MQEGLFRFSVWLFLHVGGAYFIIIPKQTPCPHHWNFQGIQMERKSLLKTTLDIGAPSLARTLHYHKSTPEVTKVVFFREVAL